MAVVAFRRPLELPVLAFGEPDQGYATARVTSPYALRSDGFHAALDIGNYRLGDQVVAAAPGEVTHAGYLLYPWSAPYAGSDWPARNWGGLMAIVKHSPAVWTLNAHLLNLAVGVGARVGAGQRIGRIGDSGSAIGQGHLHFAVIVATVGQLNELSRLRRSIPRELTRDPWPLITGLATVTDPTLEDPAMPSLSFPGAGFHHLGAGDRYTAKPGARFRAAPSLTAPVLAELGAGTVVSSHARVVGQVANGSPDWLAAWLYVEGSGYMLGFVHRSAVDDVDEPDATADLRAELRSPLETAEAQIRIARGIAG
jgi:hypothetical protein